MHEVCITGFLAHGNIKGEARRRRRHQNNTKRVVRNLEEEKWARRGKAQNETYAPRVLLLHIPLIRLNN